MDLPGYDDTVPFEALMNGDFDPTNPAPFLNEIDMYAPVGDLNGTAAGAVAALMLVYDSPDLEPVLIQAVIEPWLQRGLPYRLKGFIYEATPGSDRYQRKPAPPAAGRPSTDGAPRVSPPASTLGQAVKDATPPPAAVPPPGRRTPAAARDPRPAPAPAPVSSPRVQPSGGTVTEPDLVDAVRLIVAAQLGSTPMIQRKMRLGFGAACRIMDRLEHFGVVGRIPDSGAARTVLVKPDELDETVAFIREEIAAGR